MADIVAPGVRSRMMAGIGPANTRPEMIIRRGLHARGWRFRLGSRYRQASRYLPGKPDLVFPGHRAAIFVHGCFWHGHGCALFRWPVTRGEFWRTKISGNIARDQWVCTQLLDLGWRVLEVWECALRGGERPPVDAVIDGCVAFLESNIPSGCIGRDRDVPAGTASA